MVVQSNVQGIKLPPIKLSDDLPPSSRVVMRALADLVAQCTAIQPDQRPTFADILEVGGHRHATPCSAT